MRALAMAQWHIYVVWCAENIIMSKATYMENTNILYIWWDEKERERESEYFPGNNKAVRLEFQMRTDISIKPQNTRDSLHFWLSDGVLCRVVLAVATVSVFVLVSVSYSDYHYHQQLQNPVCWICTTSHRNNIIETPLCMKWFGWNRNGSTQHIILYDIVSII